MRPELTQALDRLKRSDVVAIPTETVYGLAADARDESAVARVFAFKGRPSNNPLIVHVSSIDVARRFVEWDDRATALFDRFAPGPLSIVMPHRAGIADAVRAGRGTVAIRIPNHPLTLDLLRAFDGPLAAPSANQSNHVSPTTPEHVRTEFGDAVFVLDGGPCRVGIESTVLDLTLARPAILRPGDVTLAQIESVIGPVDVFTGHVDLSRDAASSPGQSSKHYAPRAQAVRFNAGDDATLRCLIRTGRCAAVLLRSRRLDLVATQVLGDDPSLAAARFYAALRAVDSILPDLIAVELPPDEPAWLALRDRILRATTTGKE
ncbi:MAG: L-threonylcarbamoyladenylate synthase [Tepidisphaeraceae bacterium]